MSIFGRNRLLNRSSDVAATNQAGRALVAVERNGKRYWALDAQPDISAVINKALDKVVDAGGTIKPFATFESTGQGFGMQVTVGAAALIVNGVGTPAPRVQAVNPFTGELNDIESWSNGSLGSKLDAGISQQQTKHTAIAVGLMPHFPGGRVLDVREDLRGCLLVDAQVHDDATNYDYAMTVSYNPKTGAIDILDEDGFIIELEDDSSTSTAITAGINRMFIGRDPDEYFARLERALGM